MHDCVQVTYNDDTTITILMSDFGRCLLLIRRMLVDWWNPSQTLRPSCLQCRSQAAVAHAVLFVVTRPLASTMVSIPARAVR